MKTSIISRAAGLVAVGLPLTASLTAAADDVAKRGDKGFIEKMDQWQDKMSEKFRDTWKNLRGESKEKSVGTASVDLREDMDGYTIRLNLPDRDLEKVEIKLEGGKLHVVAPAGDKASRYEQTVALEGVEADASPKIERRQKDSMIVVTVKKGSSGADKRLSLTMPDPALAPLLDWDRDIIARMDKMRRDMDRSFEDAFREFRGSPEHKGFFDEPRFGSSVDVKEERGDYVVRAYLPDRDMQNINVTVEGTALRIEAKEQETRKKDNAAGTLHSRRKAAYSQLLTLPGPVQSDKMKVEKKDEMLVVTLPKEK